jgi:hypothetical protein
MMPSDNEQRNPFEDHIESDVFDVSQLGTSFDPTRLDEQIQTLLNTLPQPLDYRLWDEELDDIQKQLCAHLTSAVIERFVRPTYQEELGDLSDDDLLMILTVPLALAMLAQQRLYSPPITPPAANNPGTTYPTSKVTEAVPRAPRISENAPERLRLQTIPPTLSQRVRQWAQQVATRVARLFGGARQ